MVVGLGVALVALNVGLRTVPVGQRATYQTESIVTGPTLRGCGETLFVLIGWTFPAGKTVHFSWTTNPATDVGVVLTELLNDSYGPTIFSGYGSSGSGILYSDGGGYGVNVTNCEAQPTNATITAYFNYNAPLL